MPTCSFACFHAPRRATTLAGLLLGAAACGEWGDCIQTPCPLPTAIVVMVTRPAGGTIAELFVDVATPIKTRIPCDQVTGRCTIPGHAGTYLITVGAPGYQSAQRSVTVPRVRATTACGCDGVATQQVQLALAPVA